MTNAFYVKGAEKILSGAINLPADTIKAVVVKNTYAQNLSVDEFFSTISAVALGAPVTLAGKSITGGVFDASDPVFAALAAGNTIEAIVIYKDTGVAGTSPLIAYIDQCSGLPLTTDGGDFAPTWDNGPYKIIALVSEHAVAFKDIYFPQLDLLWNVPNDYADDLSNNGRTLTFNGTAMSLNVDHLDFNGTNNWLDVTGSGAGQFGTDDFTIENIVRFSNLTGTQYLYTNNFGTPGTALKVYLAGGVVNVEIGGVVKATFTPTTGVDYNWAVCRTGTTMRLFVNGVQQGASWTSAASFNATQYRLGADNAGANRFVGRQYGMRVTLFAGRYSANYTSTTVANLVAGDWPNYVRIIQGHVFKADGTPASYKVRACLASEYDAMSTTHALPLIFSAFSTSGAFSFAVRSTEELVIMVDHNSSIFDDPTTIRNHKIMRVNPAA